MDRPKRVSLTGIEITVDDEKKFVGKVGYCRPGALPDRLIGAAIFYREAPFSDAYSWTYDAIGADVLAVDLAAELGAVLFVNWFPDEEKLVAVTMADLQSAPVANYGTREQYRLKQTKWKTIDGFGKIDMGWTEHKIDADEWAADRADRAGRAGL